MQFLLVEAIRIPDANSGSVNYHLCALEVSKLKLLISSLENSFDVFGGRHRITLMIAKVTKNSKIAIEN